MVVKEAQSLEAFARGRGKGLCTITAWQYREQEVDEQSVPYFVTHSILASLIDTRVSPSEHVIRHFNVPGTDAEAFKKIAFTRYRIARIIGLNIPILAQTGENVVDRIISEASEPTGRPNELIVAVTAPDLPSPIAERSSELIDSLRQLPNDQFRIALLGEQVTAFAASPQAAQV